MLTVYHSPGKKAMAQRVSWKNIPFGAPQRATKSAAVPRGRRDAIMKQTEIYQLNLIEHSDPFSAQPLNENTRSIEEILADQKVSIDGSARVATGSYEGSGTCGSDGASTLSFPFTPRVLLVIGGDSGLYNEYQSSMLLIHPMSTGVTGSQIEARVTVSWAEQAVSWYGITASYQMNSDGSTYYYFAIG